ncbi:MAG: PSD1 and planctomycete cytochrome C domain-containing protein [Pirellulales bacterium]|nr:PSD1 and planctomycete cytochrome C domain-containing protein [Pirellulales bacterium]
MRFRPSVVPRCAHMVALLLVAGGAGSTAWADEWDSRFEAEIAPLLTRNCLECHNPRQREGNLVLDRREALVTGGDSGPAIVPEHVDDSLLVERVRAGEMPPPEKEQPRPLSEADTAKLVAWISAGAPWPEGRVLDAYDATTDKRAGRDWWAWQPLAEVAPPDAPAGTHPVDAFIAARLNEAGMIPAPAADRRTLARRLYFDLIGLPPSYEQVEAFVADTAPDAYERLVDELLASPHFGERWARYWLDVARFAETCGYERDQEKPNAWKYRDWVVDAINNDLPYDRFVLEQLAGDELPDRNASTVTATGFLRMGTWNDEPNDPQEYKYERLEDLIHTTSTAFLALTVKCARCHDHKFDPIPQTDYYRLGAVFWAGHVEPRDAKFQGGPTPEELGFELCGYTDRARDPPPLHLLRKGDPTRPEQEVAPGFLSLVAALDRPIAAPPPEAPTSQRRLQLARWIVDPQNPLPARVAVNRLWQHHFGAGLVRTPDNFGFNGQRPTHPELLDWLARELIAGGWRPKRIHKLLVMSATYQQASVHPQGEQYEQRDAGNRYWWRAERQRLDAEALRDALLAASGQLDLRVGGPSFRPEISSEALEGLSMKGGAWQASPAAEQHRRSIYMFSKRSLLAPIMTVFDFCDTTQPCAQRDVTIVAPQALALMNNEFVHRASADLAAQVIESSSADFQEQVSCAWRLALARQPTAVETARAVAHMEAQSQHFASAPDARRRALESLCHVLVNCNEFLYVD